MTAFQHSLVEAKTPIETSWNGLSAKDLDRELRGCVDSLALLAGVANTVMQLAYPPVGHGVAESKVDSGHILKRPFKRTRTTLVYLAVGLHGTDEEKLAYRRAINRAHVHIRSNENSDVKYNAFDPNLQLWVAACIYWGYAQAYERFYGPMTEQQAEFFLQACKPVGTGLQMRPEMWPANIKAFDEYWAAMQPQLRLDPKVKAVLVQLIDLKFMGPIPHKLLGNFSKLMAAGFLTDTVREQMDLPWGVEEQARFKKVTDALGAVNRRLPRVVRQAPLTLLQLDFRRRMRKGLPLN